MCVLLKLFTAVYTLQNIGLICDSTACACLYTCSSETIENEIVFISTNIELIMNHVHRCIAYNCMASVQQLASSYFSFTVHQQNLMQLVESVVMLVVKFI